MGIRIYSIYDPLPMSLTSISYRCLPLVFGSMLVFVGSWQPGIAQPIVEVAVESSPTASPINESFLGQWQSKDTATGITITLVFTPEKKLFLILPTKDGTEVALGTAYSLNTSTQPMQLDILFSGSETSQTIVELTPEGKMRVEIEGVTPGKPRPTAFSPQSVVFEKVSDATTVPDNIQVVDLEVPETPANTKP